MNNEFFKLSQLYKFPTNCIYCGSELKLSDNHKQLYCDNDFCKSHTSGRVAKWVSTLGVKEFGLTTIEKLIDAGLIDSISSLYHIDYDKLETLEGFGKRSCEIFNKELNSHKKVTLSQFIAGYNIESIGEKVIQKIMEAKGFKTLLDFVNAKESDLVCEGVGEITARKLYDGLRALYGDMGVTLRYIEIEEEKEKTVSGSLNGKSFCFTGAASRPRKELFQMVTDNGGIIHDGIKKKPLTDYLVIADTNSTSSKAVAARKLGVTLISEEDFVKMCGSK